MEVEGRLDLCIILSANQTKNSVYAWMRLPKDGNNSELHPRFSIHVNNQIARPREAINIMLMS